MTASLSKDLRPVAPGDTLYYFVGNNIYSTTVREVNDGIFNVCPTGLGRYTKHFYKSKVECLKAEKQKAFKYIEMLDTLIKEAQ